MKGIIESVKSLQSVSVPQAPLLIAGIVCLMIVIGLSEDASFLTQAPNHTLDDLHWLLLAGPPTALLIVVACLTFHIKAPRSIDDDLLCPDPVLRHLQYAEQEVKSRNQHHQQAAWANTIGMTTAVLSMASCGYYCAITQSINFHFALLYLAIVLHAATFIANTFWTQSSSHAPRVPSQAALLTTCFFVAVSYLTTQAAMSDVGADNDAPFAAEPGLLSEMTGAIALYPISTPVWHDTSNLGNGSVQPWSQPFSVCASHGVRTDTVSANLPRRATLCLCLVTFLWGAMTIACWNCGLFPAKPEPHVEPSAKNSPEHSNETQV